MPSLTRDRHHRPLLGPHWGEGVVIFGLPLANIVGGGGTGIEQC